MDYYRDAVPIDLWLDQISREDAENTLKHLVQNAPGFFYRRRNDAKWTMEVLSGHFASFTGFEPDELASDDGLQYADLIVEADLSRVQDIVRRGLDEDGTFQVSYRIETADGEQRWVLEHGSGADHKADEHTHIEGFVADITREKLLERRLHHTQKLEVIGRLAGGVAHDFNNLLSIIIGYGSLALEQIEDEPDVRRDLREVIEAADRAKDLSGQLLSFSRYQATTPDVVDVDDFLREKVSMVGRVLGQSIQIERSVDARGQRVEIGRTHLEQVLLNLVTNARDAMRENGGGTLRISSRVEEFGADEPVDSPVREAGSYVVIDIADQGQGIPVEVRDKIFDPFFTTKSESEGTGLGLATSSGIVNSAGGSIWYDTRIGEGTTFHVALPVTDRDEVPIPTPKAMRRAKVLVIDDDPKLRDLIARLLRSESINPVTTDGAESARRHWATEGDFDMIIADLVMPNISGIELVNQLLSPSEDNLPVLFLSGYVGKGVDPRDVHSRHVRFFKKPFTPQTLRDVVTDMLGLEMLGDED